MHTVNRDGAYGQNDLPWKTPPLLGKFILILRIQYEITFLSRCSIGGFRNIKRMTAGAVNPLRIDCDIR